MAKPCRNHVRQEARKLKSVEPFRGSLKIRAALAARRARDRTLPNVLAFPLHVHRMGVLQRLSCPRACLGRSRVLMRCAHERNGTDGADEQRQEHRSRKRLFRHSLDLTSASHARSTVSGPSSPTVAQRMTVMRIRQALRTTVRSTRSVAILAQRPAFDLTLFIAARIGRADAIGMALIRAIIVARPPLIATRCPIEAIVLGKEFLSATRQRCLR